MLAWVYNEFIGHDDPMVAMFQYNARVYTWKIKTHIEEPYRIYRIMEKKYLAENKLAKFCILREEMSSFVRRSRTRVNYFFSYETIYNYIYRDMIRSKNLTQLLDVPSQMKNKFNAETLSNKPIDVKYVLEIYERFDISHSSTWALLLPSKISGIYLG